jgi:hypothetical protein
VVAQPDVGWEMMERSHERHGDASNASLHGRLHSSLRSELQVVRETAAESTDGQPPGTHADGTKYPATPL